MLYAGFFEERNGGRAAAAGGQHRIDQQHFRVGHVRRKLLIVRYRLEGFFISINAQVAEPRIGEHLQHTVGHAESGPQDRHERDGTCQHVADGFLQRGLHRLGHGRPIAGDLIHHQPRDLVEQGAELAMIGRVIAQLGQLGLNDRMLDDVNIGQHRRQGERKYRDPTHSFKRLEI